MSANTPLSFKLGTGDLPSANIVQGAIYLKQNNNNFNLYYGKDSSTAIPLVVSRTPYISNGNEYISFVEGGDVDFKNKLTGMLKITLPEATYRSNALIKFKISIFNNVLNTSVEYLISGYVFNVWNQDTTTAICLGKSGESLSDLPVSFASGHSGSYVEGGPQQPIAVYLGRNETEWDNPHIIISDVTCGGSYETTKASMFETGWKIEIVKSIEENVSHTHNNTCIIPTVSAGSIIQPIYFKDGKPTATTYTLGKSVPSDAVFTDTTYSVVSPNANGLCPKISGTITKFLRDDGTWALPYYYKEYNYSDTYYPGMSIGTDTNPGGMSIIIGIEATGGTREAVGIGWGSKTKKAYSVTLGAKAENDGQGSVTIGAAAKSVAQGSVTIGRNSQSNGNNSISIGNGAGVYQTNNLQGLGISIGQNSNTLDSISIAIGHMARASGWDTKTISQGAVSLGTNALADGKNVIAIGHEAKVCPETNSFGDGEPSLTNAIQLGTGVNSASDIFQVTDYPLLNLSTGKIPSERISFPFGSTLPNNPSIGDAYFLILN